MLKIQFDTFPNISVLCTGGDLSDRSMRPPFLPNLHGSQQCPIIWPPIPLLRARPVPLLTLSLLQTSSHPTDWDVAMKVYQSICIPQKAATAMAVSIDPREVQAQFKKVVSAWNKLYTREKRTWGKNGIVTVFRGWDRLRSYWQSASCI